jgi:hypothetical protein
MKKVTLNYNDDLPEYYGDIDFYFLKDKNDLAEFIKMHSERELCNINKIPIGKWFIYHIDDSGDYPFIDVIILSNYKKELLNNILNKSALLKEINEKCI